MPPLASNPADAQAAARAGTGVGEAITNAIKHSTRGRVYCGAKNGQVWVAILEPTVG